MRNVITISIAFAAVVAASFWSAGAVAGGGACRAFEPTAASGTEVVIDEYMCFSPTVLHAEPGDTITFRSEDPYYEHVITSANQSWGTFLEMRDGDSFTQRFDEAGVYPFQCHIHPGMAGAIVVEDAGAEAADAPTQDDDSGGSSMLWWLLGGGGVAVAGVVGLGLVAARR